MDELGRRIVKFSPEILAEIITTGYRFERIVCTSGILPGARYVRGWVDNDSTYERDGTICLLFEHPDWPLGDEDAAHETITPTLRIVSVGDVT